MPQEWQLNKPQIDYWENKGLPNIVAVHQVQWERRQEMIRMHNSGMTYAAIGAAIGITGCRVGQVIGKHKRGQDSNTPPVMLHLTRSGELRDLTMSKHTMQFIGWLAGGDKPTIKLRTKIRRKMTKASKDERAAAEVIFDRARTLGWKGWL